MPGMSRPRPRRPERRLPTLQTALATPTVTTRTGDGPWPSRAVSKPPSPSQPGSQPGNIPARARRPHPGDIMAKIWGCVDFIQAYAPPHVSMRISEMQGLGTVELQQSLKEMPKIGKNTHSEVLLSLPQICAIWNIDERNDMFRENATNQHITILKFVDSRPAFKVRQNEKVCAKNNLRAVHIRDYISELRDGIIVSKKKPIRNSGSVVLCKGKDLSWPNINSHASGRIFIAFNPCQLTHRIPTDFFNVFSLPKACFVDDSITKTWAVVVLPAPRNEWPEHRPPALHCRKEISLAPVQQNAGIARLAHLRVVEGGVRVAAQRLYAYLADASRTLEQPVSAELLAALEPGAGTGQNSSAGEERQPSPAVGGKRPQARSRGRRAPRGPGRGPPSRVRGSRPESAREAPRGGGARAESSFASRSGAPGFARGTARGGAGAAAATLLASVS